MTVSRKGQLLIAACILVSSAAHAEQSELPKRQLKFKVSEPRILLGYPFPEVKFVGYLHVKEDRSLLSWTGYWLRESSQWKDMSEEQRKFINKLDNDYQYKREARNKRIGRPIRINSPSVKTPEGTLTYQVLGISEQDVRQTARAVVEMLDNQARDWIERNRKALKEHQEIIAEAERILPKLETERKQLEVQEHEKIAEYSRANYGIDSRETIPEHAKKSMEDLTHHLRLVDFELIGLRAKIDSISRFKADEKITDQGTLTKLDQMLIVSEVERAGVLARRNAYISAFKQAKELYALIRNRDEATSKKKIWDEKLANAQIAVRGQEEWLADPPDTTRPVEIHENKVEIRLVRPN